MYCLVLGVSDIFWTIQNGFITKYLILIYKHNMQIYALQQLEWSLSNGDKCHRISHKHGQNNGAKYYQQFKIGKRKEAMMARSP